MLYHDLGYFHLGALINRDFYVALGSSMGLTLLVWVGGLLKRILYFFGNEPSLGQKPSMLHLPRFFELWNLETN